MKLRNALLVAVAALMMLTACGGSGEPAKSGTQAAAPADQEAATMREFSKCIREHGAPDFPDPIQGPDGGWGIPGDAPEPPQSAQEACKTISNKLPEQAAPEAAAGDVAKWRKFASCMREKGLSKWPDPLPDGTFNLPEELRSKQAFSGPMKECQQFAGPGGLRVSG
ncbi:hypothetical protein AB0H83_51215 [Dactylosporangium sp. NPDC050688]|uniref:hypothetical protein n=1 Tax=Dactylosporangium sp. NPDC050688 TaxID=3157217 RepID=UPI003404FFDC